MYISRQLLELAALLLQRSNVVLQSSSAALNGLFKYLHMPTSVSALQSLKFFQTEAKALRRFDAAQSFKREGIKVTVTLVACRRDQAHAFIEANGLDTRSGLPCCRRNPDHGELTNQAAT